GLLSDPAFPFDRAPGSPFHRGFLQSLEPHQFFQPGFYRRGKPVELWTNHQHHGHAAFDSTFSALGLLVSEPSQTRIPMLERDQVPPELGNLYDALLAQRGVVPNMFKTLANTPSLAVAFAGFLKPLLSDSALKGWYKELIATRLSVL